MRNKWKYFSLFYFYLREKYFTLKVEANGPYTSL